MATYVQFCGQDTPGLYLVQTRPSLQHTCDIFFVHGIGGGPTKTWAHPGTKRIWFQDLLPDYLVDEHSAVNARIWTFGYNAGLVSSATASIYDHSMQLLTRVKGVREGYEHHKVIWICHSLGGLVVKWALIEAQLNPLFQTILASTVGIVFMATPHQGSDAGSMAAILARIAEKSLLVKPPTELLRILTRDSDALDQNRRQFTNICQSFKICSFHETLRTGKKIIVDRSSALTAMPGEEQCPLDANHIGICKFSGHDDQNFVVVCDAIRRLVKMTRPTQTIAANTVSAERPLPPLPQSHPNINITPPLSAVTAPQQPINFSIPSNHTHTVNMHPPPQPGPSIPHSQHTSGYQGQQYRDISHPGPSHPITNRDIPRLIRELTSVEDGTDNGTRINAAAHLARIAQTSAGRDHVASAVDANVMQHLVGHLSHSGILGQYVLVILAVVLYYHHTWTPALNSPLIKLLVGLLSDPHPLDTKISAACALANITRCDSAKIVAVGAGAVPPLVVALSCPYSQLKDAAIRAMRNITVADAGQRAAHDSNATQRLVDLLDESNLPLNVQCDIVSSLAMIASNNKDARKRMKNAGAFQKLSRFKYLNIPKNDQDVALGLRDRLR